MDEVNGRILELIDRLKVLGIITYEKDFCEIIGLHRQNLNNIKNKRQSFTIDVNYRDPFLGKMYAENTTPKAKPSGVRSSKVIKPKEALVWPVILYKGLISDNKEKNKVFVLIIDKKNYFMKIGDTENEIFLKSGDKESIYVKYKGELNLIMLQD